MGAGGPTPPTHPPTHPGRHPPPQKKYRAKFSSGPSDDQKFFSGAFGANWFRPKPFFGAFKKPSTTGGGGGAAHPPPTPLKKSPVHPLTGSFLLCIAQEIEALQKEVQRKAAALEKYVVVPPLCGPRRPLRAPFMPPVH